MANNLKRLRSNASAVKKWAPRGGTRRALSAVFLAVVITIPLAGCSVHSQRESAPTTDSAPPESADSADSRPLVLTTFTVLADMARNVAGDNLRVESITKVGAEIHGYEPTPRDLASAAGASLILDNGLGLETWFARFMADLDVPHAVLTDGITPIPIKGGEAEGHANPHAWMSPKNAVIYVGNIAAAFTRLDPSHADEYAANASSYAEQISSVSDQLSDAVASVPPERRALVTCEGAFSYLARDDDLAEKYLWPVNAESEAGPRAIGAVIDFVRDSKVPVVFCESTVSNRTMLQVVDETEAAYGGTLYVDSLSEADGPVPTYLDLVRYNIDLVAQGLATKLGKTATNDG